MKASVVQISEVVKGSTSVVQISVVVKGCNSVVQVSVVVKGSKVNFGLSGKGREEGAMFIRATELSALHEQERGERNETADQLSEGGQTQFVWKGFLQYIGYLPQYMCL